jgi:hypothetical protein
MREVRGRVAAACGALLLFAVGPGLTVSATSSHQARMSDSFVDSIGMNTRIDLWTASQYAVYKSAMRTLGIRHVRDVNQTDQPPLTWQDLTSTTGIHGTLTSDPRWITPAGAVTNIKALGNSIEAVEGANEYDGSGDPNWVTTLRNYTQQLYSDIRSDPVTAGLAIVGPSVVNPDASKVGNISAWVNYGNFHPYDLWPPEPPSAHIDTWLSAHQVMFPAEPYEITEVGYPTATALPGLSNSVSLTVQAKYLSRLFLEYFNRGIRRTFVYDLADWPNTDPSNWSANLGIIRSDGSPKPSFNALENLIALLKDPGPSFTPGSLSYDVSSSTTTLHQTLVQKRNGTFYLVLWNEITSTNADVDASVTVTFGQAIGHATTFLPMKSAAAAGSYSNITTLNLNVPDHPLVVQLSLAATTPTPSKRAASTAAPKHTAASTAAPNHSAAATAASGKPKATQQSNRPAATPTEPATAVQPGPPRLAVLVALSRQHPMVALLAAWLIFGALINLAQLWLRRRRPRRRSSQLPESG